MVPHELWHDEYFTKSYTGTLEQVNFNIHPQHNSLKNYLQLTRSDPLAAGFIRQKGATPKLEFPYEALRDRYEGKVFFHKRNRDNILLDPTNIPLYNKLPGVYRQELEELPSDEYLYSNQYDKKMPKKQHYKTNRAGVQRKSYEPESMLPERRPQYSGTWTKSNHADGIPMKKDKLPIRYTFPAEAHIGLWGGVGVLQGERFARGYKLNRRFKKEWRPLITKEYFHSELANDGQYLRIDVTPRTMELIDQAGGFEDYILGTPVCELNSVLGYLLKRDMLRSINKLETIVEEEKVPIGPELSLEEEINEKMGFKEKQAESENSNLQFSYESDASHIFEKYKKYQKSEREIEWIGLPLQMGLKKQYDIEVANHNPRYTGGNSLMEYFKQDLYRQYTDPSYMK